MMWPIDVKPERRKVGAGWGKLTRVTSCVRNTSYTFSHRISCATDDVLKSVSTTTLYTLLREVSITSQFVHVDRSGVNMYDCCSAN